MEGRRSRDELLRDLTDGRPIPWGSELESEREPEDVAFVRALHLIERIALAQEATSHSRELPFQQWSHLRLEGRIAEGSHGEVFLARDLGLDLEVALKLFRSEASDARERDVLLDEARHLAKIRHPGVAGILGADIDHGRLGFWMELVPGRNLREVMREEGPLQPARVATIGAAVVDALASIHAAGFVHQDLKPENVVETETGRIVVVDLGASLRRAHAPRRDVQGTPLYAAPEVLEGRTPTVASDIYSLGVLLYFLSTNRHPFEGDDLGALREAQRTERRVALRTVGPRVPSRLRGLVESLTATDPGSRPTDLDRIAAELRAIARPRRMGPRTLSILAVLLVVLGLVVFDPARESELRGRAPGPVLAAFEDLDPVTQADSLLARALSMAIRTRLQQATSITLVSPTVQAAYARDRVRASALLYGTVDRRRPLHVISGEVRRETTGDRRLSIDWRIVAWPTDRVGARAMDTAGSIGGLASLVTTRAFAALGVADTSRTSGARPPTLSDEAWIAFARAVHASETGRGPRSRALFERVLELAPDFAEAHYRILFTLGADTDAVQEHLRAAWSGRHQLSLQHRLLLEAQFAFARADLEEMHRVQREVLARWPDDPDAFQAVAGVALREGRIEEAVHHLERLVLLDPLRLAPRAWYTSVIGYLRGPGESLRAAEEFVREHPDRSLAWLALGIARQRVADRVGSRAAHERALALAPDDRSAREALALAALNDGETGAALAELDRIAPRVPKGSISPDALRARILHEIGRTQDSLDVLDSLFTASRFPTLPIAEAMFLNEIGAHGRASEAIERARKVATGQGKLQFYTSDVVLERGLARVGLDSLDAAEADLARLHELARSGGPHSTARTNTFTLSARIAMDRGRFEDALAFLDSIVLDHSPFAFATLGAHRERELRWRVWCLEELGRSEEAAALLDAELARTLHRPRIHFDRARVAWALGDTARARAHVVEASRRFAGASETDPDVPALRGLDRAVGTDAPR